MRDLHNYNYITQSDYKLVAGPDWPSFEQFLLHQNVPDFVYDEIESMLAKQVAFNPKSFCIMPFYNWEYPLNTPCCLMSPGHDLTQVRNKMLLDERPDSCAKCWKLEDQGIKSDRILKNESLAFYLDLDLQTLFDDCVQGRYDQIQYKIDTSNVCNSTCITCNSYSSSAWADLERKNNVVPKKYWVKKPADVDNQINYATAKLMLFRGGEPLLSGTNFYILEQLIKYNNTDCFIGFCTNGSIMLNDYQKKLISQFKKVNFCFSIDGVDKVFEYLRYPLKWNDILKNIDYCKNNNIEVSVSYTVSNLNVLYYDQTINWFEQNQIVWLTNLVYEPLHFRAETLPRNIKNYIIQKNPNLNTTSLLGVHSESCDLNFEKFKIEITKQDQWKKINMQDYLPELHNLLSG